MKCHYGWSGKKGLCDLFQKNMDKIWSLSKNTYIGKRTGTSSLDLMMLGMKGHIKSCLLNLLYKLFPLLKPLKFGEGQCEIHISDLRSVWLKPCWYMFSLCTCVCVCVCVWVCSQLCPTLCDYMDCSPPGSSVSQGYPGKNTGVGYHFLFQGIFLTQAMNLSLPHRLLCRGILWRPLWLSW